MYMGTLMLKRDFFYNYLEVLVSELKMVLSLEEILTSVSLETLQLLSLNSLSTFANSYQEPFTLQEKVQVLQV
jgi:hypothetical protein